MSIRERNTATGQVIGVATESALIDGLGSKLDVAGGKVLQIVRATASTNFTTSSTSPVDITDMTISITPQLSTSGIIIVANIPRAKVQWTSENVQDARLTIQTSAGVSVGGSSWLGLVNVAGITATRQFLIHTTTWGYDTPGVTSSVSYKVVANVGIGTITFGADNGGQAATMYAIEVSA
jgi:hypothetical protein